MNSSWTCEVASRGGDPRPDPPSADHQIDGRAANPTELPGPAGVGPRPSDRRPAQPAGLPLPDSGTSPRRRRPVDGEYCPSTPPSAPSTVGKRDPTDRRGTRSEEHT